MEKLFICRVVILLQHIEYLIIYPSMSFDHICNGCEYEEQESSEKTRTTDNQPGSIWSGLEFCEIVKEKYNKESESKEHTDKSRQTKEDNGADISNCSEYDHE